METPALICDSSSLISITDACLDNLFPYLTNKFNLKFIVPPSVEYETVTHPLQANLKQYAFSALRIKHAIYKKNLSKWDNPGEEIKQKTEEILKIANNMFFVKGKPLRLIHLGETEALAIAKMYDIKNLLIDERTTRMLIEAPFKLKEHLEDEFKIHIMVSRDNMQKFTELIKGITCIRSSELVIIGYENGYFDDYKEMKKEILEASLYKIKLSGCSIRFDEITEFIKSISNL
ncbi:MAG: hypothetical protein AABX38_04415 [Candidatus Micrarchaeota archaeon]